MAVAFHLAERLQQVARGLPLDVVVQQKLVAVVDVKLRRVAGKGETFMIEHAAGGGDFAVEQRAVVGQIDAGGLFERAAAVQHQGVRQVNQAAAGGLADAVVLLGHAALMHGKHAREGLGG